MLNSFLTATIRYDADCNHSPCMKKGHKAHWAIMSGILIFQSKTDEPALSNSCSCLETDRLKNIPNGKVYLAGRQGKSRHLMLWSLEKLSQSNLNLISLSPDRSRDSFILPEGGIEQGLKGKAILLQTPNGTREMITNVDIFQAIT